MSYIYNYWYVLGSMSLTSLPIFAQQWGRKHNDIQTKGDLLSETIFLPYFMIVWCVFFYQSVCFLPMAFHWLSCGALHWLSCGALTTQLKPIKPQNKMKKWLDQGRCSWTPPASLSFEKMTSQPTFFAACTSPKYNQFTLAFHSV